MSPIAKTWKAVANKVVNKKTVQVGFVQSTDTWKRTGNLSSTVQSQFNKKVEENANLIKSNAVGVYLQYAFLYTSLSHRTAENNFGRLNFIPTGRLHTRATRISETTSLLFRLIRTTKLLPPATSPRPRRSRGIRGTETFLQAESSNTRTCRLGQGVGR